MRLSFSIFAVVALATLSVHATSFGQEAVPPTEEATRITTLQDLADNLEAENINFQLFADDNYLVVPVEKGPLESAQVIRWAANDGVVHFIQIIPLEVPEENLAAMESSMIRLNHSFPVPGLGMNHESNHTVYFRMTVPLLPRGFLEEQEIREYFSYSVNQAINFLPVLNEVASGKLAAEGALQFHQTKLQEALGPLGGWRKEFGGSQWVLIIRQNGDVTLMQDEKVVVNSKATVEENVITFNDIDGPLAAEGEGSYQFTVTGKEILFEPVDDPNDGRKQILGGTKWMR